MSIQKKLLLGAALTAATVAGVYLASQYFGAAGMEMPVVTGEVQPPSIPGTTTPTVTIEPSTITPTITPTMPLVTPEVPATPEVEITPTVPTTITEAMPLVTPEVPVVVEPRELELRELSPYESFLGVGKPRELSPFEKIQEAQKEIDDAREWINRDKDRIKETQEWLARHEEAGIKDMALLDREFLEERIAEAQRRLRKEEARLQENLQKVEKYEKEIADAAVVEVTEIE
jgi:hypothetical protein